VTTPLLAPSTRSARAVPSGLVAAQRIAAASVASRVFIEAGPGSGKTSVAAERFGVLHFASGARSSDRGVVAISFARSAVSNLRSRIARRWEPEALAAPNHVTTVDTVIRQLLRELLTCGLVQWPNGHTKLSVHDSWMSLGLNYRGHGSPDLLSCIDGVITQTPAAPNAVVQLIRDGACTHQDIRSVLTQALSLPRFPGRGHRSGRDTAAQPRDTPDVRL
jgi:DNA helicase II / ATP-dependent DNA helicase PcrA